MRITEILRKITSSRSQDADFHKQIVDTLFPSYFNVKFVDMYENNRSLHSHSLQQALQIQVIWKNSG